MPDAERELIADGGERLDVALAPHVGSRAAAQRLIDAGLVTVDGVARPKRHLLGGGERIAYRPETEPAAPDAPPPEFAVAWEDEHLIVVDKPAGVVVHPGRGHRAGTLVQALAGRTASRCALITAPLAGGDDPERPGVVHRLDRDTSGLLVLARGDAVHAELQRMLRAREITREYLALVHGRPAARAGTVDAPLGRDRRVRTRRSTDTDEPRPAITHFETERALPHATLLRVRLDTGRTHQIRAHLRAIDAPVAGDPEYGVPGLYGLRRQFLHADRLAFAHPVTGAPLDLRSPLPADLAAALRRAERDG